MPGGGLGEYERLRLENIKRNQEVLASLNLATSALPLPATTTTTRKTTTRKRATLDTEVGVRKSRRLKGLAPTHESNHENISDGNTSDLNKPSDENQLEQSTRFKRNLAKFMQLVPPDRIVSPSSSSTTAGETTDLVKRLKELKLLTPQEPAIKITKQRIYSATFYPAREKLLVCTGDKGGQISFWDATLLNPAQVDDDDNRAKEGEEGEIFGFSPHRESVFHVEFSKLMPNLLFSAGYDNRVLRLDLNQEAASFDLLANTPPSGQGLLSSMSLVPTNKDLIWLGTHEGWLGQLDLRIGGGGEYVQEAELLTNKIGSVMLNPQKSNELLVASRDRNLYLFDARKLEKVPVWQYAHERSVTAASWNSTGERVISISHDNWIRLWPQGLETTPLHIAHNNQTGRWLTMFRPKWHPTLPIFACANMNRMVEVFCGESGQVLGELDGGLTAVPAVIAWHPLRDNVILGANASGKVSIWSPL